MTLVPSSLNLNLTELGMKSGFLLACQDFNIMFAFDDRGYNA